MSRKHVSKAILVISYVGMFYLINIFTALVIKMPGMMPTKLIMAMQYLAYMSFVPSLEGWPIIISGMLVGLLMMRSRYLMYGRKFRTGEEHGSARWAKPSEIKPLMDADPDQNIILTESEGIKLADRDKKWWLIRNKNVMVIGGSGSGKTRFFVKPNLMQLHSSYVVTDPKGTLIVETGSMFAKNGYIVKSFNTVNFSKSMHYNPFVYIRQQKDILKLAEIIIANTTGQGEKQDFWVKAEKLYYMALIAYIHYEAPDYEKNFATLLDMLRKSETSEEDEEYENEVDVLFARLADRDPGHYAVRQYENYKLAAGKTAKSILISCAARLAPFDLDEIREITEYDELELDTLGDRKQILYLIMSDTDSSFNFLIAMIYSQMFNLLCTKADDEYKGVLPVPVRCVLDEFANIGEIPRFKDLIPTIRSRRISANIILQTQSQLKERYKDSMDTIIGNCDSILFLGGSEEKTRESLSKELGKETIDTISFNDSRGNQASISKNYQKLARDLKSYDELGVMDRRKCILRINGLRPFLSNKYDITRHKRYKELADYDERNSFDFVKYQNRNKVNFKKITKVQSFNELLNDIREMEE